MDSEYVNAFQKFKTFQFHEFSSNQWKSGSALRTGREREPGSIPDRVC